jgi:hypothetical protein
MSQCEKYSAYECYRYRNTERSRHDCVVLYVRCIQKQNLRLIFFVSVLLYRRRATQFAGQRCFLQIHQSLVGDKNISEGAGLWFIMASCEPTELKELCVHCALRVCPLSLLMNAGRVPPIKPGMSNMRPTVLCFAVWVHICKLCTYNKKTKQLRRLCLLLTVNYLLLTATCLLLTVTFTSRGRSE